MNNSPDIWMHDTLAECCSSNYGWNYATCIGTAPTPTATTPTATPGLYYPDWLETDHVCRNDNGQPSYMTGNPSLWMHSTLAACCTTNYSWNYDVCVATTSSGTSTSGTSTSGTSTAGTSTAGTNKYYMSWTANTCVQSCVGASPCGGLAANWDILYTTLKTCCEERNWWNDDCLS